MQLARALTPVQQAAIQTQLNLSQLNNSQPGKDPLMTIKEIEERQLKAQQWVLQQQAVNLSMSKKAREIYVGNLLMGVVTADIIRELFNRWALEFSICIADAISPLCFAYLVWTDDDFLPWAAL